MRRQGEPCSAEAEACEQTMAAHNGVQAGATARARMVTTPQTCASKPFVRLGVAKLITYFTLRRHIARVNRRGEGAVHHGQLPSRGNRASLCVPPLYPRTSGRRTWNIPRRG